MRNKPYPFHEVKEVTNFKDLLAYSTAVYGSELSFWYKRQGETITHTFKQLEEDVYRLAAYFDTIGIKNEHVAILGENSYEWILAYLTLQVSGQVAVLLDKELPPAELAVLVQKSDVRWILHSSTYAEEAASLGLKAYSFELFCDGKIDDFGANHSFTPATQIDENSLSTIVFSSGTTGEPRGVMLSQKNLLMDAVITFRNVVVLKDSLCILPLNHAFGLMCNLVLPILGGGDVFIPSSLKRIFADIQLVKPWYLILVPEIVVAIYDRLWAGIKKEGREKQVKFLLRLSKYLRRLGMDCRKRLFKPIIDQFGGRLAMIICGGAALPPQCVECLEEFGIKMINGYGISEMAPIVTTVRNKHFSPASVGSLQPGLSCRIVDGEIQLKGPTCFLGYYNDEVATAAAFDGGWFKTGDMGYFDKDGLLYLTGRKKNLIILSNGKNVAPEELEEKILALPGICEVVVYGENNQLVAEIFPSEEGKEEDIRAEIQKLNRKLPLFKQLAVVKFRLAEFPKTSTRKIKRH